MRSLTKNLQRRAAILIAVAYAFCVLAPTAALAFVDGPTMLHCLSESSGMANAAGQAGAAHSHADEAIHQHEQSGVPDHHSGKNGKANAGNCCGLFCVSALAHDPGLTFGLFAPESAAASAVVTGLIGCAPSPLHRPPIA
jgi:hypothetical protein